MHGLLCVKDSSDKMQSSLKRENVEKIHKNWWNYSLNESYVGDTLPRIPPKNMVDFYFSASSVNFISLMLRMPSGIS